MSNVVMQNAGTRERRKLRNAEARPIQLPNGSTVVVTLNHALWTVYDGIIDKGIHPTEFIGIIYDDMLLHHDGIAGAALYDTFQREFRTQIEVMRSGDYESKHPAANQNGGLTNVKHVRRPYSLHRIFREVAGSVHPVA